MGILMTCSLDFAGLLVAAVQAAQRHDPFGVKYAKQYDRLIADLRAGSEKAEVIDALGLIEEIFVDDAFPTGHITRILSRL
jgi:hypothetical protein